MNKLITMLHRVLTWKNNRVWHFMTFPIWVAIMLYVHWIVIPQAMQMLREFQERRYYEEKQIETDNH